ASILNLIPTSITSPAYAPPASSYTITASNEAGSTSTTLSIQITSSDVTALAPFSQQVREGTTITLNTGLAFALPNDTVIPYYISGEVTADDISIPLTGSITIASGQTTQAIPIHLNDNGIANSEKRLIF